MHKKFHDYKGHPLLLFTVSVALLAIYIAGYVEIINEDKGTIGNYTAELRVEGQFSGTP